jgi:transposase
MSNWGPSPHRLERYMASNDPQFEEKATPLSGCHVILDNFATHKTDLVKRFLAEHPNVRLHFTPTYSSWLNQIESWFSKLQRDVIDRGIFTSVAD